MTRLWFITTIPIKAVTYSQVSRLLFSLPLCDIMVREMKADENLPKRKELRIKNMIIAAKVRIL